MEAQNVQTDHPLGLLAGAIADDLELLAGLQDRELGQEAIAILRDMDFPRCLALGQETEEGQQGVEIFSAWLQSGESDTDAGLDELAADYADIYLNHSLHASPLESVWLDEDGLMMQEPMFQVRDWYHRHGMAAENWRMRSDDHLVLQLQFLSTLAARAPGAEDPVAHLSEMARFMDEHPLRWVGDFSRRVAQRCRTPMYAGLVMLMDAYLEGLREVLVEITGEARPTAEEIEERMKPRNQVVEAPLTYMPGTAPSW